VGQIAHNSFFDAKNSCDRFRLRVKSEPFIGSSIDVCQHRKPRSNTELISDSHSRPEHAEDQAPKQSQASQSWKAVAAAKPSLSAKSHELPPTSSAGSPPAFFLRAHYRLQPGARRAEFISVSGQCAARSALNSDMRTKRISGGAAATEHLRAPMNSPTGGPAAQRVSFFKHQR
jgi:hypothetical protein